MSDRDPDLDAFAERLQELRARSGLSARGLAELAKISLSYLRVLEGGPNPKTGKSSRPSVELVERLVWALGDADGDLVRLAGWDAEAIALPEITRDAAPAVQRSRSAGNVDTLTKEIRAAGRTLPRRSQFMQQRAFDRLRQFNAEFQRLAGGTLDCAPADEPHVTRMAVQSCEDHLRAVSFEDLAWWGGELGHRYRETHEILRREHSDVDITRIFLIDREEKEKLRDTLAWHLELGITTYLLHLDEVSRRSQEDFVLCDDTLLRTAVTVSEGSKEARFTDDPVEINQKLVAFDDLRWRAHETRGAIRSVEDVDRVLGS